MTTLAQHFHFPGLALRSIEPADFPATIALINDGYDYQTAVTGEPRTSVEQLQARMESSEVYVVVDTFTVVGCIYLEFAEDHSAKFGLLTVDASLRNRGVGSAMIAAAESYVRAQGGAVLQLDYMSISPWLKTYYERKGFHETGVIRDWGGINLIQMEKTL